MTAHLPPSLLALFAPRPPIPYMPPLETKKLPSYSGVANFLSAFESPSNPSSASESWQQIKERKKKEKEERNRKTLQSKLAEWNPVENPKATGDPHRTLFVSRISFNTTEHKLKRELETFGPIKKLRMIFDKNGKPRGYAFVEFERERDMREALRRADGRKIDGRRILADIERGRTSKSWRPRRLGGGLGGTRGGDSSQKLSGRNDRPPSVDRSHRPRSRSRERKRERSRERERSKEREKKRHRERSRERSKERK